MLHKCDDASGAWEDWR